MTDNLPPDTARRTLAQTDGKPDTAAGAALSGAAIGYARVSTDEQSTALQRDALRAAGCLRIFEDKASGARADRPGLCEALAFLRRGERLVVWRLDRLGRSLPDLIEVVRGLEGRGIELRSLTEEIDTSTPAGRLFFHVFGALAQFERDLIRERVKAGLAAARASGRRGVRKPVVSPARLKKALAMREQGLAVRAIAATLRVSKTALYDALRGAREGAP